MLRDFLNAIVAFIDAESLTDEEYATVTTVVVDYDQASYDDLSRVLTSRDAVSSVHDKLAAYYAARGVEIVEADIGRSNIFIGAEL